MIRRYFSVLISLSVAASPAMAGGKGTTSSSFLKVPVNARAVALGGTFTAVPGDVTGLEYNPAGLAGLSRTDISFTYIDYIENTSFQSAAVGFPFSLPGKKAAAEPIPNFFDTDKLFAALRYNQFRASDDARNEVGIKQGSISIQDQLFHLGLAVPVRSRLAVGVGVKSIRQELDSSRTSNFAFDTGILWLGDQGLTAGASVLNIGPAKAFEKDKDPLPLLVRLGVSRPVKNVLLVADAVRGRDTVTRVSGGGEWKLARQFSLRAGIFHESEIGFSTGLGFMFAGPQKAAPAQSRRALKPEGRSQELVFNERRAADLLDRLNFLAAELTDHFEGSGKRPSEYQMAVLPASGAGERMGPALADLLGQQFYQQEAFKVVERAKIESALREAKIQMSSEIDDAQAAKIGRLIGASVVAVSQVTKSPSAYNIQTRLVTVEDGNAQAASNAALPADVFSVEMRQPLSAAAPAGPPPGRMDIGFDYGLSTQGDLGLTHTLSLRILY